MALLMEEKKKQRHLDGTSDGREEEAEAPKWLQWWKRGRSGDAESPYQLWLQSSKYHISSTRERADGTDDEKPQCYRTKNLMRPPPASDFSLRKKRLLSCLIKGKKCLESLSPLPWLGHLESRRNPRLLERVWSFLPHPGLDHITPEGSVTLVMETMGTTGGLGI